MSLPDSVDERVRDAAADDESFSAAVTRFLEIGLRATQGRHRPDWIGSGDGPADLGRRAERYLRQPTAE